MSIPGTTYPVNNPAQNYQTGGTQTTPPVTEAPVTPPPAQEEPAGVYTPSGETPPANNNFRPDRARMEQLWNHHQQQVDNFRRMMEVLFNRQAQEQGIAAGTWNPQEIELTDEMRAAAAEQVAEGGYFSVEETAARILDFAVAISGGDPERLDVLRGAIEQAFENAERIWGGQLPEISQQTRAAVMEGLDQWAANGNVADIALLNR
ncbi:MAG: hypothetical protein FWC16_03175 [Defluviitaleaceae bacterium]|nr:hypothetical protein [Defluviitaleaceae bacterium]MCL2273904.1 hypothetical protein [Defluviitaleaceae bacterium]